MTVLKGEDTPQMVPDPSPRQGDQAPLVEWLYGLPTLNLTLIQADLKIDLFHRRGDTYTEK